MFPRDVETFRHAADAAADDGQPLFACVSYTNGAITVLPASQGLPVQLDAAQSDLVTVSPIVDLAAERDGTRKYMCWAGGIFKSCICSLSAW